MPEDRVIPPVYYVEDPVVTGVTATTEAAGNPLAAAGGSFGGNTIGTDLPTENYTLMELVQMFIVYAFIIAAALTAFYIFYGGITFILSGGNDEKIKQAVNTIRYAIIGLIITILSFTFVTIVGQIFGLNFLDYISYAQIRESIDRLLSALQ